MGLENWKSFKSALDSGTIVVMVRASVVIGCVGIGVEKDVSELKTIDHSTEALPVLQSHVLIVVDSYLDTKVGYVFQNELQKHMADLIHKYSLQHLPELTKKPTPIAQQESEKTPTKGSKTGKSASAKEPVEEPIAEVTMDDAGDDVVRNDHQPQASSELETSNTLNL
nr:hypothetical protein [Tanacetum cinerariifolium]